MSDDKGIYSEVTDELRRVVCPAGEAIGSLRGQRLANTPGVVCNVTHDALSIDTSTNVLVKWCCNLLGGDGGYSECPVWTFEKDRIAQGKQSMADEREARRIDERIERQDITGSEYGDLSVLEPINDAVDQAVEAMMEEGGGVIGGSTGTDPVEG